MANKDFTTTILVDQNPQDVFNAINDVRGWWSENIEGDTDKLNAEFLYHYKDVHACKIKITELIPGKKVVWEVLDNHFSFTKDQDEWKGNQIIFDIRPEGAQTQLVFTQHGLTQAYECYDVCNDAWTGFIGNSLRQLIVTGKGEPTPKDEDGVFNEELIEKWGLDKQEKPAGFTFSFLSAQSPEKIFDTLLNVRSWWTGLHGEHIEGSSDRLDDIFIFRAGNGAHYSVQKLVELAPSARIAWRVIESNLTFLQKPDEWIGTTIAFDLSKHDDLITKVTFTHEGLVPAIECYNGCAGAWSKYLELLAEKLK